MELRKRKNEERQEEEGVIEEPKGFMMQEMASAIFLSEEAILFFEEQDLNAEWHTKVATTLQNVAIQCYHIIYDKKTTTTTTTTTTKSYYPDISGSLFQRVDRIESRIEGTRTCAINVRHE